MKKNLFSIDESEKQRILEMHESATKKLYLNEQGEVASTGSTASTTTFTWAEDEEVNKDKSQKELNDLNRQKLIAYYGASEGQTNPDTLIGKTAYVFKNVSDPKTQFVYLKGNVYPETFIIQNITFEPSNNAVKLMTNEGVNNKFIRLSVSPVSLQQGIVKFYSNYKTEIGDGINVALTYMYPYIKSNAKYLVPEKK